MFILQEPIMKRVFGAKSAIVNTALSTSSWIWPPSIHFWYRTHIPQVTIKTWALTWFLFLNEDIYGSCFHWQIMWHFDQFKTQLFHYWHRTWTVHIIWTATVLNQQLILMKIEQIKDKEITLSKPYTLATAMLHYADTWIKHIKPMFYLYKKSPL